MYLNEIIWSKREGREVVAACGEVIVRPRIQPINPLLLIVVYLFASRSYSRSLMRSRRCWHRSGVGPVFYLTLYVCHNGSLVSIEITFNVRAGVFAVAPSYSRNITGREHTRDRPYPHS